MQGLVCSASLPELEVGKGRLLAFVALGSCFFFFLTKSTSKGFTADSSMELPLCGLMTYLSHYAKLEAITVTERPASLFPRVVNARFASEVRGKHCASDVVVGCDTREFI